MNETRHILSTVRQAADKYSMISAGDYVAVGLSGGKDSIVLLDTLRRMRDFYPEPFRLCALTVDSGFGDDYTPLRVRCDEMGVEYHIEKTDIREIVFEIKKAKNPCSLCSRLRRGALVNMCRSIGANKLALGHHLDDAAETFMLTLVNEGRIGCYSPVTVYDDTGVTVIRPLIYTREADIKSAVKKLGLPVIEPRCPENKNTSREEIKNTVRELEKANPGLKKRIITAMEKRGIDGWKE